ncbi:DedA family protein [Paenibacillus sambharensis]|uniref:DedA family protein n=1 Tax=Paenibacillus sambharensis TaxID=1803190 RepID=A0A2W1LEY6_9BACL|nr:DedA family protein [Paenibacillus sambharensis]PZD97393.1 DedA family protein [Paenibacillus sambharensis]
MQNWITDFMESYGYFGIFLLIALENVFPPIPSEIILTFGGFMTSSSELHIWGVVAASTAGSVAGALCIYGVGRMLSTSRLEEMVQRHHSLLRVKPENIRKAQAWFDRHGMPAVFFCRLLPLVRSLISIPAGSASMNLIAFILLTTLGSLIWNTALVYLGAAVGSSWNEITSYLDIYSNIVYGLIGLSLAVFGFLYIRRKKQNSRSKEQN